MADKITVKDFFARFPSDDACLEHIMEVRFGLKHFCRKCGAESTFHKIADRRAYACSHCGDHVYPCAGTIFKDSRTSLQSWFYVIFLFVTTRHGVSGKELQRQLGVTYKTAWRMAGLIREHMATVDGDTPLGGFGEHVEIDETLIGGSVSGKGSGYKGNKTAIVGMMERGGEVVTRVVKSRRREPMLGVIHENVLPGTTVSTDEFGSYRELDACGFDHRTVNHKSGQYACADTGASVNAMEGFWAQLKRSINGTHIHVSSKHLWKYAKEAEYRFNRRQTPHLMLSELLSTFGPLNGSRD